MGRFISSNRLVFISDILELPPKTERLDFIRHIPKKLLILVLSKFNMRMIQGNHDSTNYMRWNYQKAELKHFCQFDLQDYSDILELTEIDDSNINDDNFPVFFTRLSTFIAIREILELNEPTDELYDLTENDWLNVLYFLLSINEAIKDWNHSFNYEKNYLPYTMSERLATRHQLINELGVRTHPIAPMNRLVNYIDFLNQFVEYYKFIASRFAPIGFSADAFLRHIINLHRRVENGTGESCIIEIAEDDLESSLILGMLSNPISIKPPKHFLDIDCLRFSPLYKISSTLFILIDRDLLIDKIFDQFINDFFTIYLEQNEYERIKPNDESETKSFEIQQHRRRLGSFFEEHVADLFRYIQPYYTNSVLFSLDELKRNISGRSVEISDLYFRANKDILLGEIKAKGLSTDQRDGSVLSFLSNYPKQDDYRFFYDKFGLKQIIQAISYLSQDYSLFDSQLSTFPKNETFDIYPVIIVNEKLFYSPFINYIFNEEFERRIDRSKSPHFNIHKLIVIDVESLEIISEYVKHNYDVSLFRLLYQYSKSNQAVSFYSFLKNLRLDFPIEYYSLGTLDFVSKINFSKSIE